MKKAAVKQTAFQRAKMGEGPHSSVDVMFSAENTHTAMQEGACSFRKHSPWGSLKNSTLICLGWGQ